jgi:hypothetical protein
MLMTETYPKGAMATAATTSTTGNGLENDSDAYSERVRWTVMVVWEE